MPGLDPAVVWYGAGPLPALARTLLTPLSWGFRAAVTMRNALYDAGILASRPTAVPALSVGNLTVGGTGKTPVAAELARRLRDVGARPAIVLRGYGGDEAAVHRALNPDVPVVTNPDRIAGSEAARALGCDIIVLDDAFQHRQAGRVEDVVLIAAEQWRESARLLPAGPYREPPSALARATLVVVTRKAATAAQSEAVAASVAPIAGGPVVRAALALDGLVRVDGAHGGVAERQSLAALRGVPVLAIAGVGAPSAFARQLEGVGATVELVSFPDHHQFSDDDVRMLARRAARNTRVVCTLKDAVKLGTRWPRDHSPLWYVSQRLTLEAGESAVAETVRRLLDARARRP